MRRAALVHCVQHRFHNFFEREALILVKMRCKSQFRIDNVFGSLRSDHSIYGDRQSLFGLKKFERGIYTGQKLSQIVASLRRDKVTSVFVRRQVQPQFRNGRVGHAAVDMGVQLHLA